MGQLGTQCARLLRSKYGKNNVILSDIIKPKEEIVDEGPYIFADILDFKGLQKAVVTHRIDWIIHLSALLSAIGEQNVRIIFCQKLAESKQIFPIYSIFCTGIPCSAS